MAFTYKGLTAKLEKHIVTDEEVAKQLQVMVQQTPKITEITHRTAQNGDEVVLDYAASVTASSSPAAPPKSRPSPWAAAHSSPALKSSSSALPSVTM